MNISLKVGVNATGIRAELLLGIMVAAGVYEEHDTDLVVTSLVDSKHSVTSLHYAGAAADLRTRNLPSSADPALIASEIKKRLTKDYDVIAESDHIHLEWQPRQP